MTEDHASFIAAATAAERDITDPDAATLVKADPDYTGGLHVSCYVALQVRQRDHVCPECQCRVV